MTQYNKSSFFPKFLVIVLVILLVALIGTLIGAPERAAKSFGPADRSLNPILRAHYAITLLRAKDELLTSAQESNYPRKFSIEPDESVEALCRRLEDEAYTSSGALFCTYLVYSGLDRKIQSGTFTLKPELSSIEIAQTITNPEARDIAFYIYPGWRLEEIAVSIDLCGFEFSGKEFLAYAYAPPEDVWTQLQLPAQASLEGYLYPDEYSLEPHIDLESTVEVFLSNFRAHMQSPELLAGIAAQNLSFHEALTLASIIERETRADEEKAIIASVFYNRIAEGMRLQTDPTVQYAIGFDEKEQTWWKTQLTEADLQVDSPYNTYLYAGLPPGPIANPSLTSLEAVAYPAQTPYFYFRAKCDGSGTHAFSVTYEEHLNNACP
ncbi:MAG TPA: endolytic transglycosylase MltG [Anaerolineaceae bacterium]|nr:endolytic transglycosylase MltG [Anaerolineaceae bacterium]HUM49338.1 endolytic transglycosylase MltG [Anaerolineaceae bacterium]